jgi:hypothetical protein
MANFDSNQWYQLYVNQNDDNALYGTNLFDKGLTGAVYFNATDTDRPGYRWQIYSMPNDTYVIRNSDAGANGFLGTKFAPNEDTPGQTQGQMIRGNISDASIFWSIEPWGDGTFFLTNAANTTKWHLLRKGNGRIAMSSNITAPQNGQRFSFKTITAINDKKLSTVNVRQPPCRLEPLLTIYSFQQPLRVTLPPRQRRATPNQLHHNPPEELAPVPAVYRQAPKLVLALV